MFELEEFLDRCQSFQDMMAAEALDLLIIDQPETMFYLVGYAMSEGFYQCCLLPAKGLPIMILRSVDTGTCEEHSWISDVIGFRDWDDPINTSMKQLKTRNWNPRRVGIDKNSYSLTVQRYSAWQTVLPEVEFYDISTFIAVQRATKSPREINYLRKASEIADKTLEVILNRIQPGHSARDCVAMSAESIISLGGDAGVVGPVTRSIDDTKMHALVDDTPLKLGDTLHVELIPQFLGYSARIMRPVCVGVPTTEMLDQAAQIIDIQDAQFAAMKPGVVASEVDSIVREAMLGNGLKVSYANITGYSLGYYQLFTSRSSDFSYVFRPTDSWVLKSGMVFHMYTVAKGMAFSETILVTDTGVERLTRSYRSILATTSCKA